MKKKWWQKEIVYQIYPRSFKDSNDDGIGDIPGIISKLDDLADLGVTMIWLCPIFKSPMADNGYDISDYRMINPEFGSLKELQDLIYTAKQYGIKVLLDLVINHTSDEHPWFQEALKNPTSKYRNYYIFKEGENGRAPNNWRSIFGGSAWEKLQGSNIYYLHVFHKKQPDLNWENPKMRQDIYKMINWWLDQGIAGFRLDSITFLKKDQDYASISPDGRDGLANCTKKTRNRPGIDKFLNELNRETFSKYDCVTIGEAPGVPYEQFKQFIGDQGYFSMIFDFHYSDIDVENGSEWWKRTKWTVPEYRKLLFRSVNTISQTGWGANFIENHDQPRAVSKLVTDPNYQNEIGAKAIAAMYFFLQGTPFIYQGQELGMSNFKRKSIDQFNDISSIDNYHRAVSEGFSAEQALLFVNLRSRDNTRTPYQWDNTLFGGFSKHKPWLPLSEYPVKIFRSAEVHNDHSVYHFYRKMIHLRNSSPYSEQLTFGTLKEIKDVPDTIIAYRRAESEPVSSFTNLSNKAVSLTAVPFKKVLLNNYPDLKQVKSEIVLLPYQTVLVK